MILPAGLVMLAVVGATHAATVADVTYTKQIAPLLWKHCADCHRPGEVGPFSLLTYRDAARRASFLAEIALDRRMPPWKPVPGHGQFLDERRLTEAELETLANWAEAGAPQGDPADLPPSPRFVEGWQLGTPDLVLTMSQPYALEAGGQDTYRAFVVPIPGGEDRWIEAIEFRPGNRRVVHHARVFVDSTDESRRRDRASAEPGFLTFGGVDIRKPSIGEWTPGTTPRRLPEGVGKLVKAGSDLILMMHYHPSGKPEADQSSVGLYFRKTRPTRFLAGIPLSTNKINIPPGARRHRIALTAYVPADCHAYGVIPHGHYLMRELKLRATRPDGHSEPMLWIKNWDLDWQGQYSYAHPVSLPRGTRLDVVAIYDNSAENPRNPHSPPQRVTFGPSSTDEMLGCHLQVIPDQPIGHFAFRQKWPESLESGDEALVGLSDPRPLQNARKWLAGFGIGLGVGLGLWALISRRRRRRRERRLACSITAETLAPALGPHRLVA